MHHTNEMEQVKYVWRFGTMWDFVVEQLSYRILENPPRMYL